MKSRSTLAVGPLFGKGFLLVLLAMVVVPALAQRELEADDLCFRSQQKIIGAVILFNMDHQDPIKSLDAKSYALLAKGSYLLTIPVCPMKGVYSGSNLDVEADLNSNFSCSIHGSPEAIRRRLDLHMRWGGPKGLLLWRVGVLALVIILGFFLARRASAKPGEKDSSD